MSRLAGAIGSAELAVDVDVGGDMDGLGLGGVGLAVAGGSLCVGVGDTAELVGDASDGLGLTTGAAQAGVDDAASTTDRTAAVMAT